MMLSCRERSYQEQIEILKEERKKAIIGLCLLSTYFKFFYIFSYFSMETFIRIRSGSETLISWRQCRDSTLLPMWIRIQSSILDQCGSGTRVLMTKKIVKLYSCAIKAYFFNNFLLGPQEGRLSCRRSLIFSKENIQHLRIWNFFSFYIFAWVILPSWIWIWIQQTKINADADSQHHKNVENEASLPTLSNKYNF